LVSAPFVSAQRPEITVALPSSLHAGGPRPDFNFPCCPRGDLWGGFHGEKHCNQCGKGFCDWVGGWFGGASPGPCQSCNEPCADNAVAGASGNPFGWVLRFRPAEAWVALHSRGAPAHNASHMQMIDSTDAVAGDQNEPIVNDEPPRNDRPVAPPVKRQPKPNVVDSAPRIPGPLQPSQEHTQTELPKNDAPLTPIPSNDRPVVPLPKNETPVDLLPENDLPINAIPENDLPVNDATSLRQSKRIVYGPLVDASKKPASKRAVVANDLFAPLLELQDSADE
jgi:hypothetical protein